MKEGGGEGGGGVALLLQRLCVPRCEGVRYIGTEQVAGAALPLRLQHPAVGVGDNRGAELVRDALQADDLRKCIAHGGGSSRRIGEVALDVTRTAQHLLHLQEVLEPRTRHNPYLTCHTSHVTRHSSRVIT